VHSLPKKGRVSDPVAIANVENINFPAGTQKPLVPSLAWSHIYLERILDVQDQREAAVQHYHAAPL
jgi:hypothetical protein